MFPQSSLDAIDCWATLTGIQLADMRAGSASEMFGFNDIPQWFLMR